MLLADELATRLVPISLAEGSYARNRPPEERPPWPKVGDQVYFRRGEWDSDDDLWLMRVVAVQDPDDRTSEWAPNVVEHLRDNVTGQPLFQPDGTPLIVPVADPWPWVHLRWDGDIPKGSEHDWMGRTQMTWESRVRGSVGWLPIDYQQTRRLLLPGQITTQPLPTPVRAGGTPAPHGGW